MVLHSLAELLEQVSSDVSNGLIIYSDEPSEQIAVKLLAEADPDFLAELGRHLASELYVRQVRKARKSSVTPAAQFRLPSFEHIPSRIRIAKGKRVNLLDATYTMLKNYCKGLGAVYIRRRRDDPRLKEARRLRDRMRARSKRDRGITVGQVFGVTPQEEGRR